VFFARVQAGKAHAFGASRAANNTGWYLLDSLMTSPIYVSSAKKLIYKDLLGGRASVMILKDCSRPEIDICKVKL